MVSGATGGGIVDSVAVVRGIFEIGQIWRALPLKLMLLLTAAGLASTCFHPDDGKTYPKGEFYPLSSYPMYSHFGGQDYYVYLADAGGEPVRCKDFGITAPKLKKRFKGELKSAGLKESVLRDREMPLAEIEPIADGVLRRVAGGRRQGAQLGVGDEVTMYLTYVWGEGGEIKKRSERVAGVVLEGGGR